MNIEKISILLKRIHFVRIALIVLLLNSVVFVLLVLPNRQRISSLQEDYRNLRSQVQKENHDLRTMKMRLTNLQRAQRDLKILYDQKLSPKKTGVTDIRLELESLLQSLQIQKRDFSYSYEVLPEYKLRHFMLGVPVEGSYRNIRRFINSIERSPHFLILDRVDLSSEESNNKLNLDFRLSTYLTEEGI